MVQSQVQTYTFFWGCVAFSLFPSIASRMLIGVTSPCSAAHTGLQKDKNPFPTFSLAHSQWTHMPVILLRFKVGINTVQSQK
ncbi:hypothetical protein B0H63DRAFT_112294 [Podospora didyma]|uniref:Uncharacterized protein n=1 Tax=Podospora didyma TaxID=330526 RepID=A0AAE0NZ46_9PEZI|nr:hypothetical protein B0H63DRAFT_112294 [Podospora didyma]